MSNTKFKVGDRVRLVQKTIAQCPDVGGEGVITNARGSDIYDVHFDPDKTFRNGISQLCRLTDLELINPFSLPKQTLIDLAETSQAAKDIIEKAFPDLFPNQDVVLERIDAHEAGTTKWVIATDMVHRDTILINPHYKIDYTTIRGYPAIKFTRR